MKSGTVARHLAAIAFLLLAWNRVGLWYQFLHPILYIQFAVCFAAGMGLAVYPELGLLLAGVSSARRVTAAAILLLALPWSEWFQRALPTAREDWSHQILAQSCFLYGAMLALGVLPRLPVWIKEKALAAVDLVARRNFPFVVIPVFFFFFT